MDLKILIIFELDVYCLGILIVDLAYQVLKSLRSQQAVRSFRSNLDNPVITHINCYMDVDGNVVDEKNWQIWWYCQLEEG